MSKPNPRVPSVGSDPREQPGEVAEPREKIWFRSLNEAVIEADRCIKCGSCVAACPSDSIGIDEEEGRPTLVRMCTGCSSCWDYCPRSGLRYESLVSHVSDERGLDEPEIYAASAQSSAVKSAGQDGGVVTALLGELIEQGELDGAVVATEDPEEPLRGKATLATSKAELREAAGSVYTQPMSLGRLEELIEDAELVDPDIALVGTPCVIEGAAALERYDHAAADAIALTVALLCTRSFEHDRLAGQLSGFGVDPANVGKLDVKEGTLFAYSENGELLLETDVTEFDAAGLRGCDECADFVGKAADISAGNIGSPAETTSVIVRTERGKRAYDAATPGLDSEPLTETDAFEKLAGWNRRRAKQFLEREYEPDGSIGISYTEHHDAYEGTDRAPEPLNPARVHQYEEWC